MEMNKAGCEVLSLLLEADKDWVGEGLAEKA